MRPKVHYSLYKGLFFSEFNLGFGRPKSDTCLNCDRIHTQLNNPDISEELKSKLSNEKGLHLRKAQRAYNLLSEKSLKAKNGLCDVFTFDFQQNLPSPVLTSDIFYSRQMWAYNFYMTVLTTMGSCICGVRTKLGGDLQKYAVY
ncbi:hypothetical protein PoB_005269800 [Plakobranchus ocellatus]|uniref:Uncharacterized protein n=1 Tax=Plakobranchus ocellatus TaxID=259542 RepID=A0AAV4C458_9GAST|nr:hypothetical protein PoB_005269800 [Plakobranchus ocellatus]